MISPRRVLLAGLAALMAAACGDARPTEPLAPGEPSFSRVTPGATFDWTVPERYGFDADGDGLIDYPRTAEARQPSVFPVDFDACDIAGTRYQWFVDRSPVADVHTCTYRHSFAAEGRYDVAVHVTDDEHSSVRAKDVVTVQDWLIVSFGDSYASGEGIPEVPRADAAVIRSLEEAFLGLTPWIGSGRPLQRAESHLRVLQRDAAEARMRRIVMESRRDNWIEIREEFHGACSDVPAWADVPSCDEFLTTHGLSFELFEEAEAHFDREVQDAQAEVDEALALEQEAKAAAAELQADIAKVREATDAARAGFTGAQWQPPFEGEEFREGVACHRSAHAAPALAALALERSDPKTSVTFVHLACSGAQITGVPGGMEQQVAFAGELVGGREIDAVLLSIGGDDAGFADLAIACAVQEDCFDAMPAFNPFAGASNTCPLLDLVGLGEPCTEAFGEPRPSAKLVLEDGLADLPRRYELLATELFPGLSGLLPPEARGLPEPARAPVQRVRSQRVYITEYVDVTRDNDGAFCQFAGSKEFGAMPGFSEPELAWLDETAAGGINGAVKTAADTHGWAYVGGIHSGYRTHGYCADESWVVGAHETFLIQGDEAGLAHPNREGNAFNAALMHTALVDDLYPDGLDGAPRAPDQSRTPSRVAGRVR